MTAQSNLQSCPMFVCAAGSASSLRDPPPTSRLLARSFSLERLVGAIFGSPVNSGRESDA